GPETEGWILGLALYGGWNPCHRFLRFRSGWRIVHLAPSAVATRCMPMTTVIAAFRYMRGWVMDTAAMTAAARQGRDRQGAIHIIEVVVVIHAAGGGDGVAAGGACAVRE